jgi:hypothetical protein
LAIGKKPHTVPKTANATANHRVGERECDVGSWLATGRNLTERRERQEEGARPTVDSAAG